MNATKNPAIRTTEPTELKVGEPNGCTINICTEQGELVEQIDATNYDMTKSFARFALLNDVADAVAKAQRLSNRRSGEA